MEYIDTVNLDEKDSVGSAILHLATKIRRHHVALGHSVGNKSHVRIYTLDIEYEVDQEGNKWYAYFVWDGVGYKHEVA